MKEDGGPAFPLVHETKWDTPPNSIGPKYPGMTLRDWFAGQALSGMLSGLYARSVSFGKIPSINEVAIACGEFADAMISERNKP